LGYPGSASVSLFPDDPRGIPGDTVPRSLAFAGSSSRQLRALFRVWCYLGPVNRSQPINAFPRVWSFFATSVVGVHFSASFPTLAYVPPSAFPTPSTVYSSLYLAGLFHPTRRVQGSPYRGFPRHSADLARRQLVLSGPFDIKPLAAERTHLRQRLKPGLQSFDPSADPFAPTECYLCLYLDPLLSCQTPRVFVTRLGGTFAPPPQMALPTDSSSDAGRRPTAYQSASN
jgi:hypothetical protein